MKSYQQLAEMTGATIDEVRTMMRNAHKVYEPRCVNYGEYAMVAVWRVGNAATGCIGSGYTRETAVVYALENNLQYAKIL